MMILDLHRQGLSVSAIARQTGADRKTVRKYIERGLEAPAYGPRRPRATVIDPFAAYLRERVAAYPGLTARRLLRELKERGYSGGYTAVIDFLRDIRPPGEHGFEVRFETPPGEQAQVDFAQFHVVLATLGQLGSSLSRGGRPIRRNSRCSRTSSSSRPGGSGQTASPASRARSRYVETDVLLIFSRSETARIDNSCSNVSRSIDRMSFTSVCLARFRLGIMSSLKNTRAKCQIGAHENRSKSAAMPVRDSHGDCRVKVF